MGIGVLKSRSESRLGEDRVLKNNVPEERCLTFANFVSFCSNFFFFLLFGFFLRPSVNLFVSDICLKIQFPMRRWDCEKCHSFIAR